VDEADRAEQAEQWARDMALAAARKNDRSGLPSLTHCLDCGEEIAPQRRQMGGIDCCTECQGYRHQEQQQKGFCT